MTDVIRNINSNNQVSGSNSRTNTQASSDNASATSTTSSQAATTGDQVELTGVAQQIDQIAANLSAEPAVDRQKVDEIKSALTEGRFEVNSAVIADRLIEIDDLLE